jgi:D-cysteine desulfhydrase
MERLSRELGGPKIWLKRDDLTESAASGNKLRKLEYSIGEALAQEARVLITAGGVQSNHCRATAWLPD